MTRTPARYEMTTDPRSMTITVGSVVFNAPDLIRRPEWDFDFKGSICGYPESVRDTKVWNKFYAEMLGCKFNRRFFAANYWLWIGTKFTTRTGNMLRYEGRHWQTYSRSLVEQANTVTHYVNEAERDGLYNLVPLIIAHGASPQTIRASIGRGAWRRAANNSVTRNVLIMNATLRCPHPTRTEDFVRLLEIPSGIMREINGATEDEMIAARITPRLRPDEYRQTIHLVRDTRQMAVEFNAQWSLARMRREHADATKAIMQRRYSDKKFAPDWAFNEGEYSATLLTSQADIATEGGVQHHCVASYAQMAARREYFVFRIEGKERATVGLAGDTVQQIYGACNSPVSEDCKAFAYKLSQAFRLYRRLPLVA